MKKEKKKIAIKILILGILLSFSFFSFPLIKAGNDTIKEPICEEQLNIVLEEYNSLLKDFRQGTNCGGISFGILKDANELLSKERDTCREEVGELKAYRIGFYSLFILLIILLIFYFRMVLKKENNLDKTGSEVKNARRKKQKTKQNKKTDR